MKNKIGLFAGFIVAIALTTAVTAATTKKINVDFNNVKLQVNGIDVEKETILYDGTTYVPLRASAELLGMEVEWVEAESTVYIYYDYNIEDESPYEKRGLSKESIKLFDGLLDKKTLTEEKFYYLVEYQRAYDISSTKVVEFDKLYSEEKYDAAKSVLKSWKETCVNMSEMNPPSSWSYTGTWVKLKFIFWSDGIDIANRACEQGGNDELYEEFVAKLKEGNEHDYEIREFFAKEMRGY